jgi:hypothetical protein
MAKEKSWFVRFRDKVMALLQVALAEEILEWLSKRK